MAKLSPALLLSLLVSNDVLKKSDAIVVLEGDYYRRPDHAVRLFREGWSKIIVVSGGLNNPSGGSFPARILARRLRRAGVPRKNLILEDKSLNTREQAVEIMKLAKGRSWKKIILVASHFHQFRAFLTFLKAMRGKKTKIKIYNSPAMYYSPSLAELLESEFSKIKKYKKDVASCKDGIKYVKWRDSWR